MAESNLIQFPRGFRGSPPATIDEIHQAVDALALYHVDELLGPILSILVENMEVAGFNIEAQQDMLTKDMALVMTSIRSMLCKARGISHPYQQIADETFEDLGEGNVVFRATGESAVPASYSEEQE